MESEITPAFSLKRFIFRPWVWHFLVTLTFVFVLVFIIRYDLTHQKANRGDFLLNLACLPLCAVHSILILIFSMRRFSRKERIPGLIFLLHFLFSATLTFYAYMLLNGTFLFALKS